MALSVIIILYVVIGLMSAAGSVFIAKKLFSAKAEQIALLSLLGVRLPVVLIIGYLVHGLWDVLHEMHAHGGVDLFSAQHATEIPLAYGAFCATYDWCMAGYFYTRWSEWSTAWSARAR